MICQRCGLRKATVHITVSPDDESYKEGHFCQECGRKYLNAIAKKPTDAQPGVSDTIPGPECPHCGISFPEFRNQGRLGCPRDYDVFETQLRSLLQGIHRAERHTGKTPRRASILRDAAAELTQLHRQLQLLIKQERYEEAARVRDRIRELGKADQ